MATFTCTACALTFEDVDAHKAHYRLDWHRYNLRRKVAGLGPVDRREFEQRLAAALGTSAPKPDFHGQCKSCRKSFRSEALFNQHMESKKHKDMVKKVEKRSSQNQAHPGEAVLSVPYGSRDAGGGASMPDSTAGVQQQQERLGVGNEASTADGIASSPKVHPISGLGAGEGKGEADEVPGVKGDGEGGGEEQPPVTGEHICLFCNAESEDFEGNCHHMLHAHGFFIPDVEYLVNARGLVGYVEEKIKLGHICIYCNGRGKGFHSYRSVQQARKWAKIDHMLDRSHCKLLYEEGEDLHEYRVFYDFSPSYQDAEKEGLIRRKIREGEGEDTSRVRDGDGAEGGSGQEEGDEEDLYEVAKTIEVSDLGELVLLDGRTVGNRSLKRYYQQRVPVPDQREAVQAQLKEQNHRLLTMY
ncbi:unnamed protein product, partial [Discosporangium mesarthrocarpum]